jgi:tyrosyl-tRNA synthetase
MKSSFLKEFEQRGFFAQCTHKNELDEILLQEKITAYIGFDCTAKSLHAGSLIQIMILRLLQKHGHKPIVLLGGGTTKIGDPSGKDEARKILSEEDIQENLNGIKKTLEKFIKFDNSSSGAVLVNNDDWLKNINYIEFLRDFGRHFSVNRMLTFDSVKLRLDRQQPLSFLEFNYMILQAYDFYELNKKYGCILQIGGSDQWGNIVNGVELARRVNFENYSKEVACFGLTSHLLTTADGKKMGKTASGAVWLDENLLSPFDYFQYFRNISDADVFKFLRLFTDLEISEIEKLEKLKDQEINQAKEILAFEATKICHGKEIAQDVLQKAKEIFLSRNSDVFEKKEVDLGKKLVEIIKEFGVCSSNSEAKKLIEGKAIKINGNLILDVGYQLNQAGEFELSIGKKKFFKLIVEQRAMF